MTLEHRSSNAVESGEFRSIDAYQEHLQQIISAMPIGSLRERLEPIARPSAAGAGKARSIQTQFLCGCHANWTGWLTRSELELNRTDAPYSIIHSVDPFNGDGLIDLVPAQVV